MINARAETVAPKSAFRVAYKIRRCLIPDGDCYKWKRDVEPKQLHFIHKHDGSPLALVGLWETWKGPDKTIQSCTVVTTEANSMMTEQHHHMPVMLDPQDFD
jgi:putative SOS response-associated peptidase YedK